MVLIHDLFDGRVHLHISCRAYKLDCIDLQFDALPMGCTLYAMDIGTMKKTQHSECQRLLLFTMKALLDSVDADNGDFL